MLRARPGNRKIDETMAIKIMVIEDDQTMQKLLQTLLEFEGFRVAVLEKEETLGHTIAAIRQERPEIVLLDYYLRKLNGLELLSAIRKDEEIGSIGVIITSGADVASLCLDAGANSFILKPFMADELVKTIRKVMDELSILE
jgi:DNA-binding response OmpR family regulator